MKEKGIAKAKALGKNAQLAKYYREQVNPAHHSPTNMEVNATGLTTALQGGGNQVPSPVI